MKKVSDKRAAQTRQYIALIYKLRESNGWQSELSGLKDVVACHHIDGRRGKRLLDPFNIILVTDAEHREIHAHNTPELKVKLAGLVEQIRLAQGFLK